MRDASLTLVIHWPRFGPYHLARLGAAHERLGGRQVRVVGLETASADDVYAWREDRAPTGFERHVAFPGQSFERIPSPRMWQGFRRSLAAIKPDVVAINGYSTKDAHCLLGWCKLSRRPAILMFDSKYDDAVRTWWKERAKRLIVGQFSAALCAGTLHQAYLERLGMPSERIQLGYDVVDNAYFGKSVAQVRANQTAFRHLPGLRSQTPFFLASSRFIRRKNLHGLLVAYDRYRRKSRVEGVIPWRLVVLGDGEERENLEQLIAAKEIAGITLAGFRQIEDLPAYYGLAGAFIHPALKEQWGLVINEAMASGLPVLVSERCGCVPDLIQQGRNGFTFDPEDTMALANLMSRVSSGQVDLVAMGEASCRHIQQWTTDRFVQGLYGALQAAIREKE